MIEVLHYVSEDGADHFDKWFRNQSSDARARVQARIDRVELGNFGDHKSVGGGVYELRIDFGPGFRVYYGRDGNKFVILLVGGTKKRQARDIAASRNYWSAYNREKRDANEKAQGERLSENAGGHRRLSERGDGRMGR